MSYAYSQSLGALQRTNPLPAGRYAIDVAGSAKQEQFNAWSAANKNALRVESTSSVELDDDAATDASSWLPSWLTPTKTTTLTRYVFLVTSPVSWDAATFGYPDITTSKPSDEVTPTNTPSPTKKPAPTDPSFLSDNTLLLVLASGGMLTLVAYTAYRHRKGKA